MRRNSPQSMALRGAQRGAQDETTVLVARVGQIYALFAITPGMSKMS